MFQFITKCFGKLYKVILIQTIPEHTTAISSSNPRKWQFLLAWVFAYDSATVTRRYIIVRHKRKPTRVPFLMRHEH